MDNSNPLVSVIITTKNEAKNIGRCLESITKQTYPKEKIEVIVVDDDSIDKTVRIAKKYTDTVYNPNSNISLNTVRNHRGAQLNFGVKAAKGQVIFFPDADMTFDDGLIQEAISLVKSRKYDALYIPETVRGNGLFGQVRNFERSFYNQTCIDAVRIVKKRVYLKVRGFDEQIDFGPDDWDFTKSLKKYNYRLGITKNNLYHHEEWMTWKAHFAKKSNYISSFDSYIRKWGKEDPDIKKQFGFWYRYLEVFTENGKWRRLIRYPIFAMRMYLLRLCLGSIFIKNKICKKY